MNLKVVFFIGILSLFGVELLLRIQQDPDNIDFIFEWCFFDRVLGRYFEHLSEKNSKYIPITSDGFRGTREVFSKKQIQIIVTGAGHNFANNIPYGRAWPELLETKLSKQGIQTEVLNRSMNGSTVVFANKVQLSEILHNQPTHVILSHSGYNESILSYISDDEVIRPNDISFNIFMSSEINRLLYRYFLTMHRKNEKKQKSFKVNPVEFVEKYEEMILKLTQNNIEIILLQQEVITPDIEGFWKRQNLHQYREAFRDIAKRFHLQIIDPKDMIEDSPELYFDNKEYYNFRMHSEIADEMSKLFQKYKEK